MVSDEWTHHRIRVTLDRPWYELWLSSELEIGRYCETIIVLRSSGFGCIIEISGQSINRWDGQHCSDPF